MSREPLAGQEAVRGALVPQDLLESSVGLLLELCQISSESGDAIGLRAMASRMAAELERRGVHAEVRDEPGADGAEPLLIAGAVGRGGHLLAVGHLDTVLEANASVHESGRVRGTGALDMKGGLVALLGALDLLARRGVAPPDDLLLVVVPDEEVGGPIAQHAVRRFSEQARAVLVLEPGEGRGEAETVVVGRRGLCEWRLEVRGRSSHSGIDYWTGRSALVAAADWCQRAVALSGPGNGPTVNVARLVAGTADVVDGDGLARLLGTPQQRNVIPDRAIAEGEARFLSQADGVRILEGLSRLASEAAAVHGVCFSFEPGTLVAPVDPAGPGRQLAQRAGEIASRHGWTLEVEEDRGGISFPNFLASSARIPVIDGLGPVGGGMHTRDEYVEVRSLGRRIALLAELLEALDRDR